MGSKRKHAYDVEFAAPPPERIDYHWDDIAELLRKRPGEWALVHRDVKASVQWSVNARKVTAVHPDKGFRTRSVANTRDGMGKQWIGELWMVYDPDLDILSPAKKNGGKR